MTYEFEGRTEKEAIEKAVFELGIDRDSFDVEILEAQRGGLFKKGYVRILLHTEELVQQKETGANTASYTEKKIKKPFQTPPDNEFEAKLIEFITTILERMGASCTITIQARERKKILLDITTPDSAIIIGKKGKTLDALQLLVTFYARKIRKSEVRVILDCENYRLSHEEFLVRTAYSAAKKVRSSKRSILLEPMNPYDRRVIHTAIGDDGDVITRSEGDGLYKQIRVLYKNSRN